MSNDDVTEPRAVLQMWGLAEPSRRGPQARHTLDEVVREALSLADREGIRAVTLASVASRLDITTTGIYRYVDSKEVLDELVVDAALGEPPSISTGDAQAQVLHWVDELWRRYLDHGWLCELPPRRAPRCPNAYAWLDSLVTILMATDDPQPLVTAVAIDTLTRGYAQQERIAAGAIVSPRLRALLQGRYPQLHLTEADPFDPHSDLRQLVVRILRSD